MAQKAGGRLCLKMRSLPSLGNWISGMPGLMVQFKELLEKEGVLASEDDRAYITDLRLLQYLRARDHNMGAPPSCASFM
eukprot:365384-Chlamydomonas_euryale.AAC.1